MYRKGIILAGGKGTRLYPLTVCNTKQLLPVYDKPMIYYPLSVLMLSKIRDIAIITAPEYKDNFERLLGTGEKLGLNISYYIQKQPKGLADAFLLTKNYIKNTRVCLILGDNIFYGQGLEEKIMKGQNLKSGATIYGYQVRNPSNFGVVEFDKSGSPISIEEKPKSPKSNFAVTGLYYYDQNIVEIAESIKPSERGELEITDINLHYLKNNLLKVEDFGRGFAWLDMGEYDSLLEAGQFIQTIEKQQGLKIACLEEIAFKNNWINDHQLEETAANLGNTNYGKYLMKVLKKEIF